MSKEKETKTETEREMETQQSSLEHSLEHAIHHTYDDVIQDIVNIYEEIEQDLKQQRKVLMADLNAWTDIYYAKYSDRMIENDNFQKISKTYQDSKLDLHKILNIDEKIESQQKNDISKIIYKMIKSKIYQDFNHKNSTKYISNALQRVISGNDEYNQYNEHNQYNQYQARSVSSNSILNQLNHDNKISDFENVTLFRYEQSQWNKINIGKITLYHFNNNKSEIKYLKFESENLLLSLQEIDCKTSNIKQLKKNCVYWTSLDLLQNGKYYVFLGKFDNNDKANLFSSTFI